MHIVSEIKMRHHSNNLIRNSNFAAVEVSTSQSDVSESNQTAAFILGDITMECLKETKNFNSVYHIPERSAPEPRYLYSYADGHVKYEGDEDEFWTRKTDHGCFSNVEVKLCQKCGETLTAYGDCFNCGTLAFEQERILNRVREDAMQEIESEMRIANLLYAFINL